MTLRHWFFLVNTQHFCNVFAVQIEIGYHSQLIEALQGHYKYKANGSDLFHALNVSLV